MIGGLNSMFKEKYNLRNKESDMNTGKKSTVRFMVSILALSQVGDVVAAVKPEMLYKLHMMPHWTPQ